MFRNAFLKFLKWLVVPSDKYRHGYNLLEDKEAMAKIRKDMEKMSWHIAIKESDVDYNGTSFSAGMINSSRDTIAEQMKDPAYASKVAEWEAEYGYPAGYTASIVTKTEYDGPKRSFGGSFGSGRRYKGTRRSSSGTSYDSGDCGSSGSSSGGPCGGGCD